MEKKLSFFSTRSAASQELAAMLSKSAAEFGYTFHLFSPEIANSSLFFEACIQSEIVIVDGTIESEVENDHYANFNFMHVAFDHIWIVSRSYLPVNFTTMFRDIAPSYPFPASHPTQLKNISQPNPWGNQDIVRVVTERMPEFSGRSSLAAQLPPLDYNNPTEFFKAYTALMEETIQKDAASRRKGLKKVFVSYRSVFYKDVMGLQGQYKEQYDFIVMPPGSLAYEKEVLPRLRRWQLMSVLDRQIDLADEFWVYDQGDYDRSWWTQGELITLAYRKYSQTYCPEIKTYNPVTKTLSDGYVKMPSLKQVHVEQIARRYSNSDPLTMGPENLANIRKMRRMSELPILGNVFHWFVRKLAESKRTKEMMNTYYPTSVISKGEIKEEELLEKIGDKEYFRKYLTDPVWEPAFWENAVLEYGKKVRQMEGIDVERFIDMSGLEYIEFSPSDLKKHLEQGSFAHNGIQYSVYSAAPRYLWIPNRMGKRPNDNLQPWSVNLFVEDSPENS